MNRGEIVKINASDQITLPDDVVRRNDLGTGARFTWIDLNGIHLLIPEEGTLTEIADAARTGLPRDTDLWDALDKAVRSSLLTGE